MGISSPGIGSNLDVNSIVSKLLAVESRPLDVLARKESGFKSKAAGLTTLSGAVATLQGSLSGLSNQSTFQSISAIPTDSSILTSSATSQAVAGTFNINVSQLAQSQTIATAGQISTTSAIGLGGSTTLSFQFGTISGGSFGFAGSNLAASVASNGIADGSLSINGTSISTDSNTKSAKALAAAINAKTSTTGVSASAAATTSSATLFANFGDTDVGANSTFTLAVDGITIGSQTTGGAAVSATSIDATLATDTATQTALAAAGITFTGTAAAGTLQFSKADGANLGITETISGTATGGIGKAALAENTGSSTTATSRVTISSASASPITIAGNNPSNAGLLAGTGGTYIGATYTQDGNTSSGSIVIDGTNNSLQGIRDTINKSNFGVTATIVSDGTSSPNRLVLTSTKSGGNSSFRISASGASADTAITNLLTYDPAGTQNLTQNTAAQSTKLTVNGIAVSNNTNTITGAIQGVTLNIAKVGNSSVTVARDTGAVRGGITGFVKAFNDFNNSVKTLTSFDPDTRKAGALLGDSTTQRIQADIRKQLSTAITGLTGTLTNLGQIGIAFQKDGSLLLDSAKLQTAISNNFDDISGLFTSVGKTSDSLIKFTSSTAATQPGTFDIKLTQLASQGSVTGTLDLRQQAITIAADTSISVTLNGTDPVSSGTVATVNIAAGEYSATNFASALQSAINSVPSFAGTGSSANVSINDSGFLEVKSSKFGSTSNISLANVGGTDISSFLGTDPVNAKGTDVAGTIGDTDVTGSGQFLTGKTGTDSEGIKIEVTGGGLGNRGSVIFTQGYAAQLNALASTFIGNKGLITNANDGLSSSIKSVGKSRDEFNNKLADVEKRLRAQFSALDVTIGRLNSTSSFLSQQLAALSKQSSS